MIHAVLIVTVVYKLSSINHVKIIIGNVFGDKSTKSEFLNNYSSSAFSCETAYSCKLFSNLLPIK